LSHIVAAMGAIGSDYSILSTKSVESNIKEPGCSLWSSGGI
jgi:hypothetical protein